jgi:predicted O-methyltransferase YrrM
MKYVNPEIDSSYRPNDIGETLYELVLELKPRKIIEFGTLHGYSAIAMAMACDENGFGEIDTYDLWSKYPYKKANKSDSEANIANYGLTRYVNCNVGDITHWHPEPFDLMHIDVSNTGATIKDAFDRFKDFGGIILFEGGSQERDNVEWMKKYNKPPINGCGVPFRVIDERFPSLAMICV